MRYTIAAALVLACAQSAFGLTVDTPSSVVQCQPVLLSWREGTGPFFLSILPGGQPSGQALKTFDKTDSQTLTWNVDIPAGTRITIALKDNTGATAFTDAVTIQPSSDSSCLNGSTPPAPNSAAATAAPGGTSASGTTPATTAVVSGSAAASGSSSAAVASARPTGTTRAAAVSATPTNGAVARSSVTYGLAGVLVAVGAALF